MNITIDNSEPTQGHEFPDKLERGQSLTYPLGGRARVAIDNWTVLYIDTYPEESRQVFTLASRVQHEGGADDFVAKTSKSIAGLFQAMRPSAE